MLNNKCKQIQDMLADYRTGLLNGSKVKSVNGHIAECPECAGELARLDQVLEIIDSNTPEYEPPTGLWHGVYNAIEASEPPGKPTLDFWAWWRKPVRIAMAGTMTAAAAIIISLTYSPRGVDIVPQATTNSEYVQAHLLYAGQTTLADRISYLAVATSADNTQTQ